MKKQKHPTKEEPLFSFVILGDTHIAFEHGSTVEKRTSRRISAKFERLLDKIEAMAPEFVIHLGDVTHPSPRSDDYADTTRAFFERAGRIGVPWHLLPGNHDIGEKRHRALPELDPRVSISEANISQFERHYGPHHHSFEHKGCVFVLVNSLLFNSGLPAEADQWVWLEDVLTANAGKRLFLFSHYPLFLGDEDEPEHYDNLGQPARARLAALIRAHDVEGCYSGHVHNFFYNRIGRTHHFTLPSTSILRHDYLELFRTPPESRELGRYHPAKSGFFWVDVHPQGHVPHFIRESTPDTRHTHAWRREGAWPMLDLRMPWCERQDVSSPWGVEIFERKRVRNDYPLLALWEMGVRDLRIPVSDLEAAETARRVRELAALEHRFTAVMFGLPDAPRRALLRAYGDAIHALEIVAIQSMMDDMAPELAALRQEIGLPILLNPVHAEVQGYTSHHGIRLSSPADLAWLDGAGRLTEAVDGFVVGVGRQEQLMASYARAREIFGARGMSFALHVQNVGMYRATVPDGPEARHRELNRVAEAAVLARAHPDTPIVLDNFVEQDRGYLHCFGLVDRTYNPLPGSCVLTRLDPGLPTDIRSLRSHQAEGARVIEIAAPDCAATLLLLPERGAAGAGRPPGLPLSAMEVFGESMDLVTGAVATGTMGQLMAGNLWPPAHPTLFRAAAEPPARARPVQDAGEEA